MSVETNYAIAIAALSDKLKNLKLVFQPCNEKQNQTHLVRAFSKLHVMVVILIGSSRCLLLL